MTNITKSSANKELLEECRTQLENWKMLLSGEWDGNEKAMSETIAHLEALIARGEAL